VTGVRALAFTRAGDEEAGGAVVSTRDQLADELDHSARATSGDEIGESVFAVYGMSVHGYTGFGYGFWRAHN
jgi:hypothetical protein